MSGRSIDDIAAVLAAAGFGSVLLSDLETAAINDALSECNGNHTHAAQMLGLSTRTLQRKLKVLGHLQAADDTAYS